MGGFHGIDMDSIWNGDLIIKIYHVLYGIHGLFHLESMDHSMWIPWNHSTWNPYGFHGLDSMDSTRNPYGMIFKSC
jgi:hypothetical protein